MVVVAVAGSAVVGAGAVVVGAGAVIVEVLGLFFTGLARRATLRIVQRPRLQGRLEGVRAAARTVQRRVRWLRRTQERVRNRGTPDAVNAHEYEQGHDHREQPCIISSTRTSGAVGWRER